MNCLCGGELWLSGWARLLPSHFDKYASVAKPIIISLLCRGLQCTRNVGYVRVNSRSLQFGRILLRLVILMGVVLGGYSLRFIVLLFYIYFIGMTVTYLWTNLKISMAKSWDRGCRKLAMWCEQIWVNLSHSHWSFSSRMVVM